MEASQRDGWKTADPRTETFPAPESMPPLLPIICSEPLLICKNGPNSTLLEASDSVCATKTPLRAEKETNGLLPVTSTLD